MLKIFISENDQNWRGFLSDALTSLYSINFWANGKDFFKEITADHYDAVILDLQIEKEDPFNLLSWINSTMPYTPVIMTSQTEKAELVVKAIKQGAFDFVSKPFSASRIQHVVQQAVENRGLKNEIDYLRHEQDVIYDFDRIIAFSPGMKDIIKVLKRFSMTDSTILMTGETGAGKSFLSGTIHFNSQRRKKPFIKINCANIPETLLESELFGHEKGAFTGADKLRIGRFEQARGGTLFLDEIGEISSSLQSKLLRVLEEKCFERVGGNRTIHSDVRIIAATNRNLEERITAGKFREDLYYRINVLFARIPPIRERKDCIEPLAYMLLEKICRSLTKKLIGFSPEVIEWIKTYDWPGNIRQLANTIERAVILEENSVIQKENIFMLDPFKSKETQISADPHEPLELHEKERILKALEDALWVQKDAAKLLRISPRALNYKIKKFDITHPRWRENK